MMSKRITVTLNDMSAKYFAEVQYSLDKGDDTPTTQNDVINHCLQELSLFEKFTDNQLTNWLQENYSDQYKEFLQVFKKSSNENGR